MARVNKNDAVLTPKEMLDRALVPDWEWPYKLPENWCWTRTGYIAEIASGGTPSSSVKEYYEGGNIPWISPADLSGYDEIFISHGAKSITSLGLDKSSARLLPENTVCLSSRAPIGYVAIAQNPICTNQGFKNFLPSPCYLPKYLYWYLKANKELLESYASGTTFLELSASKVAKVEIPLAPLAEQQRIVDRIESLFAKLDEAKEKAQATLDSFETRKAAILHKAFTGELTAKWREEHDTDLSEWRKSLLSDVVSEFKYGTSEKSDYDNAGMPVIRIPNIGDDGLDFTDLKYLPHNNVGNESQIHENDVLIIRSNGSRDLVGKSVRVPHLDQPYTYASFLIRIKPTPIVRSDYLVVYLNSADARSQMFKKAKSSAGINNINSKELGAITLSLPSTEEQFEIVQILENHISKEQRAKDISEAVLEQIDLIKKAILSHAFRGELGTNAPTEESAVELLKQILSGKTEGGKATKKSIPSKKIPTELAAMLYTKLETDIVKLFYQHSDKSATIDEIMAVGKNKIGIISTLTSLEQRGIIVRLDQTNYCIKE